jgi:uncharacterized protein (TIGR03083 family)
MVKERMDLCGTNAILNPPIREVDEHLFDLLGSLEVSEWALPTIAPQWCVRDVAAHLLDTALRKLSMSRDQYRVEKVDIRSNQDIVELVNRLNREGVTVYRRLSPPVIIEMMRLACGQAAAYYESLDPFGHALGVSWAGETTSFVWFDNARELTERWHHQQQIRLATNRPGITIPALYHPVLDTFMRGLPYAYRNVQASPGTAVLIEISGDCGGQWCLVRSSAGWTFREELPANLTTHLAIPQDVAWRLFTKGIDRNLLKPLITLTGSPELAEPALGLVAIVG